MSDCSNLIDVEIYLDFFLPLNEGNDDPPNCNYSESVTDFPRFTEPMNEPTLIMSFN